MDIEKRLRQLNSIQPDLERTRVFRARLLTALPRQFPKLTLRSFLTGAFQSGSAMALTGLLLFIAVGGFSIWKFIYPAIGLDPRALRVEAEALDIQVHLADLRYQDTVSGRPAVVAANPGLKAAAVTSKLPAITPTSASATSSASSEDATSTTATSTVIDVGQVLELLSQ